MDIHDIEKIELERQEKTTEQKLKKQALPKEKLDIVYLMVWTKTCGGSKIILEYANRLAKLGHKIKIVTYDQKPNWFSLDEKIDFIKLNPEQKMEDNIPNCDLVVATSWKNIYSAMKANVAPVAYFEQGGGHIFDIANQDERKKEIVENRIKTVPFVYTVSSYARDVIKKEYQKEAFVVPNAVDSNIFYQRDEKEKPKNTIDITTIGPEEFAFKHVDNIIQAVSILKEKYKNIVFHWISQSEPKKHLEKAIINPPQIEIGNTLRNTDIYICASDYESFGLPVLEAMTCGAAVVTTDNGGISDFVQDKVNGLIVKKNSVDDIVEKVEELIKNKEYRKMLAKNASKTAQNFNWNKSVELLEQYYKQISQYKVENNKERERD